MSNRNVWTEAKRSKLIMGLKLGATNQELAQEFKTTPKAIERAITNYGLSKYRKERKVQTTDEILVQEVKRKKVTRNEAQELIKYIGAEIYNRFKVIPLPEPKAKKSKTKKEEISILDISDVHVGMINETFDNRLGKQVVTYNHEILLKEMANLQKAIFDIHSILEPSYRLRKIVINVLGDIITNDRIFEEQVFEIEECAGKQIWTAIPLFSKFFNNLLNIYEEVEVNCVVGNHGRSRNQYNEPVENNFEYFVYKTWEKQFQDSKRIKINVPDSRRAIVQIGPFRHLLEHGDAIKGFSENAVEKQINNLHREMGGFDVMHFGHLHKLKEREISDKVIVKQNGCWIWKDDYAFKYFKTYSVPKQHFFGCNDKRVETWNYKLDLRY